MKKPARRTKAAKILTTAIDKTEKVQDDLNHAAHDLNVTNTLLSGPLSTAQAVAAVAGAVKQNVAAEIKVQEAAEELETVKDMLKDAQAAQGEPAPAGNVGEGVASVIEHLKATRGA
ncbi:MAG: hypothetical protein V4787_18670 [Pseudomonadota bacterium]